MEQYKYIARKYAMEQIRRQLIEQLIESNGAACATNPLEELQAKTPESKEELEQFSFATILEWFESYDSEHPSESYMETLYLLCVGEEHFFSSPTCTDHMKPASDYVGGYIYKEQMTVKEFVDHFNY